MCDNPEHDYLVPALQDQTMLLIELRDQVRTMGQKVRDGVKKGARDGTSEIRTIGGRLLYDPEND